MLFNLLPLLPASTANIKLGGSAEVPSPEGALQSLGRSLKGDSEPLLEQFPQFAQWLEETTAEAPANPGKVPEWIQGMPQSVLEEIREVIVQPDSPGKQEAVAIQVLTAGLTHLLQQQNEPATSQPIQESIREWLGLHPAQSSPVNRQQAAPKDRAPATNAVSPQVAVPSTQTKAFTQTKTSTQTETSTQATTSSQTAPPATTSFTTETGPSQDASIPALQSQKPRPANPSVNSAPTPPTTAETAQPGAHTSAPQQATSSDAKGIFSRTDPPPTNASTANPSPLIPQDKAALVQAVSQSLAATIAAKKEQPLRTEESRTERSIPLATTSQAQPTKIADAQSPETPLAPKNLPSRGSEASTKTAYDKFYTTDKQTLTIDQNTTGARDAMQSERMPTSQQSSTLFRSETPSSGREFALDTAQTNRPVAQTTTPSATPASRPQASVWTQQISDSWERMRSDGVSRMTVQIQLNHNERISVELRVQGQTVQTRFFTESEAVRQGLQQSWDELTTRFAERGARLELPQFQNSNPSNAFRQDFGQQPSSGNGSQSRQDNDKAAEPSKPATTASKKNSFTGTESTSTLSAWA
ncbi:MAG: flagellar hook-length control protein FliK [Opitutales bacterium]|nr:flagellar hook-length control protein FliK [Opitutales bacterium]